MLLEESKLVINGIGTMGVAIDDGLVLYPYSIPEHITLLREEFPGKYLEWRKNSNKVLHVKRHQDNMVIVDLKPAKREFMVKI